MSKEGDGQWSRGGDDGSKPQGEIIICQTRMKDGMFEIFVNPKANRIHLILSKAEIDIAIIKQIAFLELKEAKEKRVITPKPNFGFRKFLNKDAKLG